MSINHLNYVLQEIDKTSELLSIKNSTFFKRSLARLIAIRIDDFIKIGFLVNKRTVNEIKIKNELNALQALYSGHFKLQRDKYGAHFQYLDFATRLENWTEINAEKVSFFTEMPIYIYGLFSSVTGYKAYSKSTINANATSVVEEINDKFNLEQIPNISSDILSLTRPNSGGILNFTMIHTKAGVLKSLELLIDYNWKMVQKLKHDAHFSSPFKKLSIIDLLSYIDNYFTRTDITNTSPQYEEGFDHYIAMNVKDGTKEGNEILFQFKTNFKLHEHITELRRVRNKVCGHIDTTKSVEELQIALNSFDFDKFYDLYVRLKAIFRSVCHSTIYLKQYLFDPFEKLHGVQKIVAGKVTTFDGQPFEEPAITFKSINNESEYIEQYTDWLTNRSDSARSFFWDAFTDSEILERVQVAKTDVYGGTHYRYHDLRKAHQFFQDKLQSDQINRNNKVAIIDLFEKCKSGDPETLAYILDKTYPFDLELRVYYIRGLGELSHDRSEATLERCIDIFNTTNLQGKCISLRAIFSIDLSARRNHLGKHTTEISNYSTFIKSILNSSLSHFEKLSLSLSLLSDFIFGDHFLSDSLVSFYKDFLIDCFIQSSNTLLAQFMDRTTRERLTEIQDIIHTNRFATLVGLFSEFIEQLGFIIHAKDLRTLVVQEYISYSRNDNNELHNLAVIHFQAGDLDSAINIAMFLIDKNAHQANYNYLLLDLYRYDKKYRSQFDTLKKKVLDTFNLNEEERQEFENITT